MIAYTDENYAILKNELNGWGVLHERAETAQEALSKILSSANLGRSWAYEVIILDGALVGQGVAPLLKEIRQVSGSKRIKSLIYNPTPHAKKTIKHMKV